VSGILYLHVDGASRGNPGEAGFGVHAASPDGREFAGLYGYLGRATNNVAEYQALLHALRFALEHGASEVEVFSDSELLVRQIEGRYRVKNPGLLPLHGEARALLARFGRWRVTHVPRERNREADALANRAVDEKGSNLPAAADPALSASLARSRRS
jgi:ribonuclease HI